MKVKSIYKRLKPRKWYNYLFDKIVEDGSKRYEKNVMNMTTNPKS